MDLWPPEIERSLPCGCGGTLVYGSFPHVTYTLEGYEVEVPQIVGWKCNGNCGLVTLMPGVSNELYRQVGIALENLTRPKGEKNARKK